MRFFRHFKKNKAKQGVSMLELVIAIAIFVTLASIIGIAINHHFKTVRDGIRKNDLSTLAFALESYYVDNERKEYPKQGVPDEITGIYTAYSTDGDNWIQELLDKNYLKTLPKDPKQSRLFNLVASLFSNLFGNIDVEISKDVFAQSTIILEEKDQASAINTDSISLPFTVGSGNDYMLVVGVSAVGGGTQPSVSNVTYGALSLTSAGPPATDLENRVEIWYLSAPPLGADTINVTLSASTGGISVGATGWSGVSQVGTLATNASIDNNTTAVSVDVVTNPDDIVVDVMSATQVVNDIVTVDPSQLELWNNLISNDRLGAGSSEEAIGSTTTMSWTLGDEGRWAIAALPLKPSPPPPCGVQFDNASQKVNVAPILSQVTWDHTISGGNNRILVVGTSFGFTTVVTGVTYNGTPLAQIGSRTNIGSSADDTAELWYLQDANLPSAGTYQVEVTVDVAREGVVGATSWSEVEQITPTGFVDAIGDSATPTINVTSNPGEVVVDALSNMSGSGTASADAGQTERWNNASGPNLGASSSEAGAANVTMSWTLGFGDDWTLVAVPLKPDCVIPPPPSPSPPPDFEYELIVDPTGLREEATIWATLEVETDKAIYFKPNAACKEIPLDEANTTYNFCMTSKNDWQ